MPPLYPVPFQSFRITLPNSPIKKQTFGPHLLSRLLSTYAFTDLSPRRNPNHGRSCEEIEIDRGYHSRDGNSQVGKVGLPPLKIECHSMLNSQFSPQNLHLRKVSLALSNCLTLNSQFETEWHSIWSGGKPTFPTCEFPLLE